MHHVSIVFSSKNVSSAAHVSSQLIDVRNIRVFFKDTIYRGPIA
jgi:hypothetical protein